MQENTAAIIPEVPEAKRAAGNKTDIHITARAAAAGMIFQPMIAAGAAVPVLRAGTAHI